MASEQATTVDWWAFRSLSTVPATRSEVAKAFHAASGVSSGVTFQARGSGWQGYESSDNIMFGDLPIGVMAYGGKQQNGWVYTSFSATGVHWMRDCDRANETLRFLPNYSLRRVDIALTAQDGSLCHSDVLGAYRAGEFTLRGRPPSLKQILPDDPREGRTIYIGNRANDKFFRGYEKGFEMLAGVPAALRDGCTMIDGAPPEDIYRLELELKPKTCELPGDLIDRRDQYFAGAYPYLQHVLNVEPELLNIRPEKVAQMDMDAALAQVRHQYGSTLFTALIAHHGSVGDVWAKICGDKHNERLLATGALMVEHC